ncbi:alpha/beta hydrolase family protein [Rhizomonospora bruguierae]|uniref:alpha/beta hydrolase family protein n=1 Tax=Rhizomonospora bruguierae TaxID=1581705 RepID=UPI001BCB80D1|nr:alpha/beta fold hydrolase [Micromonospora sp. NBRC 107566]
MPEFVERGADRVALHHYPEPEGVAGAPVAVLWPAMGVPARYYRPFAEQLRAAGLAVVVADLRGTGASTPPPGRRSRYGYPELVADVAAVQAALAGRLAGRRVLLVGHSLGGQACLMHLATSGDGGPGDPTVDGLVLVGVGLPHWRLYRGVNRYGVRLSIGAIRAASAVLGVWPGWGFGGRQARGVIRDWSYTARTGRFPRLGETDPEAGLAGVTVPVLAVDIEGDGLTPAAVLDHLCAKLPNARVKRETYTRAEAGAPLDHFRWARAAGPLATRIAAFATAL